MKKSKFDMMGAFVIGGVVGLTLGFGISAFIASPLASEARIYQRESKPAVMRLYKVGADGILVESPERKREYVQLEIYLGNIRNKLDRKIERAEIRKAVKWYEE